MALNIGVLVIATNQYTIFLKPLIDSLEKNFFVNEKVTIFLFTDKVDHVYPAFYIEMPSLKFPEVTMMRYNLFHHHRDLLYKSDYLFYIDVDSLILQPVDKEILPEHDEQLVVVQHPGFWKGGGTWETRPESMFYVRPNKRTCYVAGGFNGGKGTKYLTMARELGESMSRDLQRGITPVWHDESALNWYTSKGDQSTKLKILTPSYMYPDKNCTWFDWVGDPIIMALDKDHTTIRS